MIAIVLMVTTLSVAAAAPWLIYWIALNEIESCPTPARHTATAEQVDSLFRKLRLSQPVHIDPISPYSYFLQGVHPSASTRIAWIIARSHNVNHLSDHRYWHLSGAALTIWLTRYWTSTELIARAVELENLTATSVMR
ncbi:hypothetical protein [Bradyrhizobium icense]|uniref:hypothetical protein n=1 Tax=Bradyrhizobium icense TaxID=1274631 RepID=UPI0012EA655B|nr:hypothetical protein [Bradyrhizobium icense]